MSWTVTKDSFGENKPVRIAILDLYEGKANQGMRCIREIIQQWSRNNNIEVESNEFDVRLKNELPAGEPGFNSLRRFPSKSTGAEGSLLWMTRPMSPLPALAAWAASTTCVNFGSAGNATGRLSTSKLRRPNTRERPDASIVTCPSGVRKTWYTWP